MKISCLPVSIFSDICNRENGLAEWARAAKEIGYDGIDISIMFLKNRTPTYLKKVKKELEEIGLPIVMMTTYPDFTNPCKRQREREFLYLQGDVALCSELNVRYLRILAGQAHPEAKADEAVKWVDYYFHKIDRTAKKFGVGLVFENHGKPGAWDCEDFTFEPENFLRICERIRDTDIQINFDTGNITARGGDPMDILPKVMNRVATIHVTDMAQRGVFSPTVIGTGVTPNPQVFRYLRREGFQGWLCIEEASGNGLEGIQNAYSYVKNLWEQQR